MDKVEKGRKQEGLAGEEDGQEARVPSGNCGVRDEL